MDGKSSSFIPDEREDTVKCTSAPVAGHVLQHQNDGGHKSADIFQDQPVGICPETSETRLSGDGLPSVCISLFGDMLCLVTGANLLCLIAKPIKRDTH